MPSVARIHSRRIYRGNNATSTTWTHKVPSLNNGALFVEVFARNCGAVTPPTWNGTALTLVPGSEIAAGSGTSRRYSAWFYMLAPTAGTANLVLAVASADSGAYGCKVFDCYNVDQTTPFRSQGGGDYALADSGTANTSTSLSPASSVGDLVLSALYSQYAPTMGSGQFREAGAGTSARCWTMSKEASASSTTLSATMSSGTVVHSAIAIIGDATTQPAPADYTGSRGKRSWVTSFRLAGEGMGAGSVLNFGITPTTESGVGTERTRIGVAGTCSLPAVTLSTNATTGSSVLSLLINGVASGITVTIPAGTTGRIAGTGTAAVSVGDEVDWQMVVGSGGSITVQRAEFVFEASGAETVTFLGAHTSGAALLLPGETRYNNVHGQRTATAAPVERRGDTPIMVGAQWSGLGLNVSSQTLNGAVDVVSRINGVSGNQILSWTSGEGGLKADTTHTDTVTDGDSIDWMMTAGGSTGDFNHERFQSRLVTTDGEFLVLAGSASSGNGANIGAAGTVYFAPCGELGGSSTESDVQMPVPFDMAIKRLWIKSGESTGVADCVAVLRVNGVDTALTAILVASGEHYWAADFENVVNANAGDLISIAATHGTGGANNTLRVRGVGFVGIERVAGSTAVEQDLSGAYAVINGVQQDSAAAYTIVNAVAQDLSAAYAVRGAVEQDLSGAYAVINGVHQDSAAAYTIVNAVAQDLSAAYVLVDTVQQDCPQNYGVAGTVSQDFGAAFDILASGTVSADFASAYAVVGTAQHDLAAAYGVSEAAQQDLAASYVVINAVVADVPGAYAIANAVVADAPGAYAILDSVFSDLTASWAVPGAVSQDFGAAYTVYGAGGGAGASAEEIAETVWNWLIEGMAARSHVAIHTAALAGKSSGVGTDTETYYGRDGVTPRLTVTFDAFGNRDTVTLNGA